MMCRAFFFYYKMCSFYKINYSDLTKFSSKLLVIPYFIPNQRIRFCKGINNFSTRPENQNNASAQSDREKIKRVVLTLKAKRPGFTEEKYGETSYYEENGLRKVYPYYFTFTTFCKRRWIGLTILEIFAKEFRAKPLEEYERIIKTGLCTVNYQKVDVHYKLQDCDLLCSTVHRHETPVTNSRIEILHESDDLVVVNKPSSIPVFPCSRYRHNSVYFILGKEYNLKNLKGIYRLDSLTSGVLLFGKNASKANQIHQEIRSRSVKKEYVCRVEGEFPIGTVCCEKPIDILSKKIGAYMVGQNGKKSKTEFERISYNGETSVLLCKPVTGRSHQIRVHLQYLGHPIVNDPLYNNSVFGPEKGRGGQFSKTNEEIAAELIRLQKSKHFVELDEGNRNECIPSKQIKEVVIQNLAEENLQSIDNSFKENLKLEIDEVSTPLGTTNSTNGLSPFDPTKLITDSNCNDCKLVHRDPRLEDLVIYLHAWRYQGKDWKFETKLPSWAN